MRGRTLSVGGIRNVEGDNEPHVDEINFAIHKFTNRSKPANTKNIVIFPCFSEFGTEVLGTLYCIPMMMRRNYCGKYSIAMGWQGRAFLYKNLVDEFWEIDPQHMWLRKYCRAFHHHSKNLFRIEKNSAKMGTLVDALAMGVPATYPRLQTCLVNGCGGRTEVFDDYQLCKKCNAAWPAVGLFSDPVKYKAEAVWPVVSEEKKVAVSKYVKPNSVGITARNRDAYGRNLPPIFYERLIYLLEDMGYSPIWLGEKQTILPCPFSRIPDFSVTEEAKDLENTLALVSQLRFTVQFWTASTRLAGLVGTPYILIESPDQLFGGTLTPGHEGFRLYLCTKGNKKLVLAHYKSVAEDHNAGLGLVGRAVAELESGDFSDVAGLVEDQKYWSINGK